MSIIAMPMLCLGAGLLGLVWGADKFVDGSVGLARHFGISSLIIGLTLVSIGTSAPEIIVSVNAALENAGGLAVGNAIGSNLANMGLVLGITALIAAIPVNRALMRQEVPLLIVVTGLAGLCLYDGNLGRGESIVLALTVIPVLLVLANFKKADMDTDPSTSAVAQANLKPSLGWLVFGLIILLLSAKLTVWGATSIASHLGVSDLVIGLTVVAIGTSLPELAASVMSAIKGHHDIAVGNIIGSNLFNILLVMTAAGAIAPIPLSQEVFYRDYISMAAMTGLMVLMLLVTLYGREKSNHNATIPRGFGLVLLLAYAGYYIILSPTFSAS
jgi:cation:H+ antiporter